jgi:hypothetical protein
MQQFGFEEGDLCLFKDPFLRLKAFTTLYNIAMNNREELLVDHDDQDEPLATTNALTDLFDNFLALEVNEESETISARAEAANATSNEEDSPLPAMDMFLNVFFICRTFPSYTEETRQRSSGIWQLPACRQVR